MSKPTQLRNQLVSAKEVNSSIAALIVHTVDESGAYVSPGSGSTQVSIKEIQTSSGASVMDSTNNAIGVTIRAGSAAGTEYTDGDVDASIAGSAILFDNSSNTLRPVTLSRGLPVNVVAGSAASTEVTIRQSTFTDLNCRINAPSTANAANYLPVRITDGSSFVTPGLEYTDGSTASSLAGPSILYNNSSNNTMRMVGTAQPLPAQVRTSSGADMSDSTNAALRVNVVAGAAGGTQYTDADVDASITGTALVFDNSSNTLRPVTLTRGLPVNVVAGSAASTVVTVSTGSVRVHQSTAADLNVTVAGYSTTVNISSLAGPVIVRSSAANALVTAYQSTAADLNVTASQNSTAWSVLSRVTTSSGGGVEGSTTAPAVGVTGLHVRQVYPTLLSTRTVITSSNSTALYTLQSSAANPLRHKVYAYSLTSTETTPSTLVFFSSNTIDRWAVSFGSGSSGIMGANLTISPPAWLFHTDANNALRCLIEKGASTQCIVTLSYAYFTEA